MQQPARMELVDSLRGFALMGLFLVHCVEMFELYWAHPVPGPVFDWTFGLFSGKSFALFALCFGLSFFIIMDRSARQGIDFTARFAWRLAILFAIGILHSLIYRGDILQLLAPFGLLLLLFDRIRSNRVLLLIALLALLQLPLLIRAWAALHGAAWANAQPLFMADTTMPILEKGSLAQVIAVNAWSARLGNWSFYLETGRVAEIIGLFLVGLVLGRIDFFADPDRFRTKRRILLAGAALLAAALHVLTPRLLALVPGPEVAPMARQSLEWALDSWSALSLMTVEALVFIELYQGLARPLLRLLAPVGRMTLTLYVGQSLVFVPIFYGFGLGLYDKIGQPQAITLGVVAFALQIALANLWFRAFHYGPLEWLWRALTRTTTDIPFVRRGNHEAAAA